MKTQIKAAATLFLAFFFCQLASCQSNDEWYLCDWSYESDESGYPVFSLTETTIILQPEMEGDTVTELKVIYHKDKKTGNVQIEIPSIKDWDEELQYTLMLDMGRHVIIQKSMNGEDVLVPAPARTVMENEKWYVGVWRSDEDGKDMTITEDNRMIAPDGSLEGILMGFNFVENGNIYCSLCEEGTSEEDFYEDSESYTVYSMFFNKTYQSLELTEPQHGVPCGTYRKILMP